MDGICSKSLGFFKVCIFHDFHAQGRTHVGRTVKVKGSNPHVPISSKRGDHRFHLIRSTPVLTSGTTNIYSATCAVSATWVVARTLDCVYAAAVASHNTRCHKTCMPRLRATCAFLPTIPLSCLSCLASPPLSTPFANQPRPQSRHPTPRAPLAAKRAAGSCASSQSLTSQGWGWGRPS